MLELAIDQHIGDRHPMRRNFSLRRCEPVWMIHPCEGAAELLEIARAEILIEAKLFRDRILLATRDSFKQRFDGIFEYRIFEIGGLEDGRCRLGFFAMTGRREPRQHLQQPIVRLMRLRWGDGRRRLSIRIRLGWADLIEDVRESLRLRLFESEHYFIRPNGLPLSQSEGIWSGGH